MLLAEPGDPWSCSPWVASTTKGGFPWVCVQGLLTSHHLARSSGAKSMGLAPRPQARPCPFAPVFT